MDIRTLVELAQRSMTNTYDGVQSGLMDRLGVEPKRSTMELVLPALGIFGAGLAAGAALGVIFAPKKGEEFRSDIKHRISDIRERGVEQLEDARSKGEELLTKGEELIESARSYTDSKTNGESKPNGKHAQSDKNDKQLSASRLP